jgi:hypothetical protein
VNFILIRIWLPVPARRAASEAGGHLRLARRNQLYKLLCGQPLAGCIGLTADTLVNYLVDEVRRKIDGGVSWEGA